MGRGMSGVRKWTNKARVQTGPVMQEREDAHLVGGWEGLEAEVSKRRVVEAMTREGSHQLLLELVREARGPREGPL